MLSSNWIKSTKQTWKLILALLLIISAFAFLYLAFKQDRPEYMVAFLLLSIISIVWFIYSPKCPFCNYKIVHHQFFREKYKFGWLQDIMNLKICPSCRKDILLETRKNERNEGSALEKERKGNAIGVSHRHRTKS